MPRGSVRTPALMGGHPGRLLPGNCPPLRGQAPARQAPAPRPDPLAHYAPSSALTTRLFPSFSPSLSTHGLPPSLPRRPSCTEPFTGPHSSAPHPVVFPTLPPRSLLPRAVSGVHPQPWAPATVLCARLVLPDRPSGVPPSREQPDRRVSEKTEQASPGSLSGLPATPAS